jgi:glycosyltransferase involved in cell wall biosynthesis
MNTYQTINFAMQKISIITVCKNEAEGIENTILSVINQTFTDFEFIVIDGGSTDGTLEIISRHKDKIDIIINDESGGVYKAMNRGISIAKGEYLIFMNGGDSFTDTDVLERVIVQTKYEDIIYGDARVILNKKWSIIKKCPSKINLGFLLSDTIPHQSAFIRKDLFDLIGDYNEKMKVAADYAFFLEAIIKHKAILKHLPFIISEVQYQGLNSSPKGKLLRETEKRTAQKRIISERPFPILPLIRFMYSVFIKYPRLILGLRFKPIFTKS